MIILITSIVLRAVATVWSFILLIRIKDFRIGFLTLMLTLMASRQGFTLFKRIVDGSAQKSLGYDELPGLIVSLMAFAFVYFLTTLILENKNNQSMLIERYQKIKDQNNAIINLLPDLLLVLSKQGVFLDYGGNKSSLVIEPEMFLGKKVTNVFPKEFANLVMSNIKKTLDTNTLQIFNYEIPTPYPHGQKKHKEARAIPYGDGVLIIVRDVTAYKKIEKELIEEKKKSEQANKAKSQFLANMSHEIRTPMNAVVGAAELLSQTSMSNYQTKYVKTLTNSSKHLLILINDILDFSKIESGKLELKNKFFNLYQSIHDVVEILEINAIEKGLKIFHTLEIEPSTSFFGDEERIWQVLVNLTANAIKFTNSGKVEILVKAQPLNKPFVQLTFIVKDTGIGIEEENISSLFSEFTQLDYSYTKQHSGTGLGLAISKKLVDMMGGKLSVSSTVGQGSEFFFSLKMESQSLPKTTKHINPVLQDTSNFKILIAEDNDINQMITKDFLDVLGYNDIDIVENGQQAVEKALGGSYDIILMDIHMPIMDGIAAAKHIRNKIHPNKTPTIIAFTGDAFDETREYLLNNGLDDFVSKPITLNSLKDVLKRHKTE